jgi:hypothetical protein
MASHQAECVEILVLGNEYKLLSFRELPNLIIFSALHSAVPYVFGSRIEVRNRRKAVCGKSADRKAISMRRNRIQVSFAVRGEGEAGQDILAREIGKISKNLFHRHAPAR